jgi:hypothetical protein
VHLHIEYLLLSFVNARIHAASEVGGKDVGARVAMICLLALSNALVEQKKLFARTK